MADQDPQPTRPAELSLPPDLAFFPSATRAAARDLVLALHADDGMYSPGDDLHYLFCGASALNVILSASQIGGLGPPASILDFGSGAGRVTRWLRAGFPTAEIGACDLRTDDVSFCRHSFDAQAWESGTVIEELRAPRQYDLIWVGSVLTHLPPEQCRALLLKLLRWTNPGGLVVASTIGRAGKARHERGRDFIHPEGWTAIEADFSALGFGYADYEGYEGYGLSLIKPSWIAGFVEGTAGARLVLMAEQAWDGLHDIVVIQNDGAFISLAETAAPDTAVRDEIEALKARVEALEATRRVDGPFRRATSLGRGSSKSG